jgi:hypothetical protein
MLESASQGRTLAAAQCGAAAVVLFQPKADGKRKGFVDKKTALFIT